MVLPYKEKWAQALAIMAMPQNVPQSLANLLTLADDICYYAGDRSVDVSSDPVFRDPNCNIVFFFVILA